MSKVIINVDNKYIANALAIWFESGDALAAFYTDQEQILDGIRNDGEEVPVATYASVDFGQVKYDSVTHNVDIDLEDYE